MNKEPVEENIFFHSEKTQVPQPVARHATAHVARQCHEQAGDGIHVQRSNAGDDQCLAAERDNTAGQERSQKQSEKSPLGEKLNQRIEHSCSLLFAVFSFQLSLFIGGCH